MAQAILVVEDEFLISMDLMEILESNGYEVAGPFTSGAATESWLAGCDLMPAASLVDYILKDGPCDRLLEDLKTKGIPTILLTGAHSPPRFEGTPAMIKPVNYQEMLAAIRDLLRPDSRPLKAQRYGEGTDGPSC
jgi:DNA-binding response OmpR family regulator